MGKVIIGNITTLKDVCASSELAQAGRQVHLVDIRALEAETT